MTLIGMRARNHPQQRARNGSVDGVDDRAITPADFAPLLERFGFTVDAAAADHNARLPHYWTRESDGLAQSWAGERVWCNPPYSNVRPWVTKAWVSWRQSPVIVLLLPANRTEQRWWQDLIEPARDRPGSPLSIEFLPTRMRFLRQGELVVPPNARPPFGCCLAIWSRP